MARGDSPLHHDLCTRRARQVKLPLQVNGWLECLEICLIVKQRGPHYTTIYAQQGRDVSGCWIQAMRCCACPESYLKVEQRWPCCTIIYARERQGSTGCWYWQVMLHMPEVLPGGGVERALPPLLPLGSRLEHSAVTYRDLFQVSKLALPASLIAQQKTYSYSGSQTTPSL